MHIKKLDLRQFRGRIFFTTDLHGYYDLLHEKLKEVAFDENRDILIVGGDLCDRGPDSRYILDYLDEPWFHSVRGNHEEMFIDAYEDGWESVSGQMLFANGGEWVKSCTPQMLKAIYEAFKDLPLAIELTTNKETIGVVHAQVPYNNWEEFSKLTRAELEFNAGSTAQWARTNYDYRLQIQVKGVDRLFVGHTPTFSGEIEQLGNTYYCDLGSFFRNKICMLEIENEREV